MSATPSNQAPSAVPHEGHPDWVDIGGVCASAGLTVIFVVNAVRNAAALYREETRW